MTPHDRSGLAGTLLRHRSAARHGPAHPAPSALSVSPPILVVKITPPGLRLSPLTVLTGPPGAGKTMALVSSAGPVALAWVHLERYELREVRSCLKQAEATLSLDPDRLIGVVAYLAAALSALAEGRATIAIPARRRSQPALLSMSSRPWITSTGTASRATEASITYLRCTHPGAPTAGGRAAAIRVLRPVQPGSLTAPVARHRATGESDDVDAEAVACAVPSTARRP